MRKVYTMTDNLCVSCGDHVPEGRQVCPACEARAKRALDNNRVSRAGLRLCVRCGRPLDSLSRKDVCRPCVDMLTDRD